MCRCIFPHSQSKNLQFKISNAAMRFLELLSIQLIGWLIITVPFTQLSVTTQLGTITAYSPIAFVSPKFRHNPSTVDPLINGFKP
jgi:hypothetical protein